MMRIPLSLLAAGRRGLSRDEAHYLTRVHRLSVGAQLIAFDPETQTECDATLVQVTRDETVVELGTPRPARSAVSRRTVVLQCLPKGRKMDAVVRDATELGATHIIPVQSERCVSRARGEAATGRWARVVLEAARQSGRGDVPSIAPVTPLADALTEVKADPTLVGFCLDPRAARNLRDAVSDASAVAVLIGPEGGLNDSEIEVAHNHGFTTVRLGRFVMRTETACAASLGALAALLDE